MLLLLLRCLWLYQNRIRHKKEKMSMTGIEPSSLRQSDRLLAKECAFSHSLQRLRARRKDKWRMRAKWITPDAFFTGASIKSRCSIIFNEAKRPYQSCWHRPWIVTPLMQLPLFLCLPVKCHSPTHPSDPPLHQSLSLTRTHAFIYLFFLNRLMCRRSYKNEVTGDVFTEKERLEKVWVY